MCKIEDTRSILLLASTGMGIAIVPKDWINLIPVSTLKYKEIDEPSLNTNTTIVLKKDRYLSTCACHFLEDFREFKNSINE